LNILKGKDDIRYLGTKAKIILKRVLKKYCEGTDTDSIILAQKRECGVLFEDGNGPSGLMNNHQILE
jgi:hypothetical protein